MPWLLSVLPFAWWVHGLDPVAWHFPAGFPLEGVRWYGLAYASGLGIAWVLLYAYQKRGFITWGYTAIDSLMGWLTLGVVAGGRVGYAVLYAPEVFKQDPAWLVRLWEPGMASHGGFVGVGLVLLVWSRVYGVPWAVLSDVVVTLPCWGIALGRIANFINAELWGKVSTVPWAVIFPTSAPWGWPVDKIPPRHPSQLYEAALEGLAVGLWVVVRWVRSHRPGGAPLPPGQLTAEFLVLYAAARTVCEVFREPDAPLIAGLSRGQFYSLGLLGLGLYLGYKARLHKAASIAPAAPQR